MANIKSQIKRVKTNEKRRQRNKSVRSSVRTAVRRFREAVEAGDAEKATELQRAASKALDKAASKGVIHKNQAANRKSAMAKRVNTAAGAGLAHHSPTDRTASLHASGAGFGVSEPGVALRRVSRGSPGPRTSAAPLAPGRSPRPARRP